MDVSFSPDDKKPRKRHRRRDNDLPDIGRTLPQSLDAEKGLLGSILLSPDRVLDECVTQQVGPKYFHSPNYLSEPRRGCPNHHRRGG